VILDASEPRPAPSPDAADAGSGYPPTGEYEITSRVVSDDCPHKYVPPSAPWRSLVQAAAEGKHAKVNVPLAAVPPSNDTRAMNRSDVIIEPRRQMKSTEIPMPACSSYARTRTMDVVESGPNGFTIAISVAYGDAIKCSSLPPSKCTTKVEHVYKLVNARCPAECTRGLVFRRGDGGPTGDVDVDCRCP
jgi:hypothetical protein